MSTTDSFADAPVFDTTHARRIDLLQKTVAKGATGAELATFLELCGKYDLDPFAKEAWCAISDSNGKRNVLIMIGRDGLRKIAMRQGFVIDGDIVHDKDTFTVTRNPDRSRTITHVYADKDRGPVLGAWAEVYDGEGRQRGYFYALMTEYRPKSEAKLKYSPWGSQESVMILAAAERTALSMATPLSGVLSHGELDRAQEREDLTAGDRMAELPVAPLPPAVEDIIARAASLGHGLSNRGAAAMAVTDQPEAAVAEWCRKSAAILDLVEAGRPEPEPEDAVVVEPEARSAPLSPDPPRTANPPSGPVTASEAPAAPPEPGESGPAEHAERIAALRRRGEELLASADALAEDDPRRDEIEQEFGQIADEVERLEGPGEGQATLL